VTTDKSGRTSAGILLWRSRNHRLEVLLAHQGGPYWVNKDLGHWTIPKGEVEEGEELVAVARREFAEETGHELPDTPLIELGEIRQKSGKLVLAWAARGDLDAATAVSNTYQLEWPPRSGRLETFPEIDRVEWFRLNKARRKLKAAQVLHSSIGSRRPSRPIDSQPARRVGVAQDGRRVRWPTRPSRPHQDQDVRCGCLIIRLIIQTIRQDQSGSDQIDDPSNLSSPDRSGPDQIDAEHQATDLTVGGSSPSRRAKRTGQSLSSKRSSDRR